MEADKTFIVGKSEDLVKDFGIEPSNWEIRMEDVPEDFRRLISVLNPWAIGDDTFRSRLVDNSSYEQRQELIQAVEPFESSIIEWLAGPEAAGPEYSDAYMAFSYMMDAFDQAKIVNSPDYYRFKK
jgi:hypothetical protein